MHKIVAALIASTLVVSAYAQTPAATPAPDAPAAPMVKKHKTHAHKAKHAHKVKKDASST